MKKISVLYSLLIAAGFALIIAGCGGGGSGGLSNVPTPTATSVTSNLSADDYVVYGNSSGGAGREAAAGAAASELIVLPAGISAPAGYSAVSGATVQFTDADGNTVTVKTDANGHFGASDITDPAKSSDKDMGTAILKAAQADISKQPSITALPPAAGSFANCKPGGGAVTFAQKGADSDDVVSFQIFPNIQKILTGKKIVLYALGIEERGRIVKPPLAVTWTVSPSSAGACSSPSSDKSFICVFTTPGTAGAVTITATTQDTAGGTNITATTVLDVFSVSSLFALTGTVYNSNGAGWKGAVLNFDIPPSADTAPFHISAVASAGGGFSVLLPPDLTFNMSINSPSPSPVLQCTPATFTSGAAAAATGTQNFTASAPNGPKPKPPAPPPPVEKYVTNAIWDLSDAVGNAVMDPESGIAEAVFSSTAATGTISGGKLFKNWTWIESGTAAAPVWTFSAPHPSSRSYTYKQIVVSSSSPVTKVNMTAGTPATVSANLNFTVNLNKGGYNSANRYLTTSSGSWTYNLTVTPVTGNPSIITGTVTAAIKYFSPDRQNTPQRNVSSKWTFAAGGTTIENTITSGDGSLTYGNLKIVRTPGTSNCTSGDATCTLFTYTTPDAPFITTYTYLSDNTQVATVYSLTGSVMADGSGTFTLTNTTTGDPQNGVQVTVVLPAPPKTLSSTPSDSASGSVSDNRRNKIANFIVDFTNFCSLRKYQNTRNEVDSGFQL